MNTKNEPKNPSKLNRRRQLYVKKKFQRSFIFQFSFLMLLGCVAFGLALYLYSTQTLTTAFIQSKLKVMSTADFLLPALILTTLTVSGAVAFFAALRLLLFSHKIAGPLYRLEKTAQAIGNGNLNLQVKLRSDDELQDFAESMDGMVRDLRARAEKIRSQVERLRGVVLQAEKISAFPQEILKELKDTRDQLDEAVSHFQV